MDVYRVKSYNSTFHFLDKESQFPEMKGLSQSQWQSWDGVQASWILPNLLILFPRKDMHMYNLLKYYLSSA